MYTRGEREAPAIGDLPPLAAGDLGLDLGAGSASSCGPALLPPGGGPRRGA